MPDLYIYNGTKKTLDLAATIYDVMVQRNALIPPGSQGKITAPQADLDATLAQLTTYGAVPHASIAPASQPAFSGVSHSKDNAVTVASVPPPIVVVPPPSKPPQPAPTQPTKK